MYEFLDFFKRITRYKEQKRYEGIFLYTFCMKILIYKRKGQSVFISTTKECSNSARFRCRITFLLVVEFLS